jgi:hypothetical protein
MKRRKSENLKKYFLTSPEKTTPLAALHGLQIQGILIHCAALACARNGRLLSASAKKSN